MKTPRVNDFDPNAKLPELGSPMDHMPAIQKPPVKPVTPPVALPPTEQLEKPSKVVMSDTMVPRYHETMTPRNHDTITPSNRDSAIPLSEKDMIEAVRKAVKQFGKEASTQRLTLEEKQELADIEYSYKRQGIKTSGNEIIRIATNYIVRDYRKNGENSILAKVLNRLNF
jgi:hypothetical protein